MRRIDTGIFLLLAAIFWPGAAWAADQMPEPHPDASLQNTPNPNLVLQIKFASDGHVASCKAVKKSSSAALDKMTVDFIRANWNCPSMAGHTARVPIDYQPGPTVAAKPAESAPAETSPAPAFGTGFNGGFGGGSSGSGANGGGGHVSH